MNKYLLLGMALILNACMPVFSKDVLLPSLDGIQAGDIVITTPRGIDSVFLSLALRPRKMDEKIEYNHAEMVFQDVNGELLLGGVFGSKVNAKPLLERLKYFDRFAVYRPLATLEQRLKASETLRQWINDPVNSETGFDYNFNYEPGRTNKFFCAGIINEANRIAGVEPPFSYLHWKPNYLSQHLEEILGTRLKGLLDINSIRYSKHYQQIINWYNPDSNQARIQKSKDLVLYLLEQYKSGWRLQPSTKTHLALMLFNPPKSMKRLAYLRISLGLFRDNVFATWNRLKRRGQLNELDEAEKSDLFNLVLDKYREKYFIFVGATSASG